IIATKNKGKAREFKQLFEPFQITVKTLDEIQDAPDIDETGDSFEANAILKAEGIAKLTQSIVIADDSGLMVDELDGRPGIFSARYAGPQKNDEANIDKVLNEMREVPVEKRSARFVCALAIAGPNMSTR